jgi:hypothetical protein
MKHGYDPNICNYKIEESFAVRVSTAENGGRVVYATKQMTKGVYVGSQQIVHTLNTLTKHICTVRKFLQSA